MEHFVRTQRTDRTGVSREELPQGALVEHTLVVNAQALINISRKRLCSQASPETREAWRAVIDAIWEYEPELASVCVREYFMKKIATVAWVLHQAWKMTDIKCKRKKEGAYVSM